MSKGPRNITNDYTPDGRKLSSRHVMSFPKVSGYIKKTTTDMYVDGLILRDGKPLMWLFDGGYVDLDDNGAPTGWNYYVTDHLGSTRKVVDCNDSIRETISYYPFGSEMRMQDPSQMTGDFQHPYRFTGKELDRLNGLNMYDFGARWYDVAGVPMWTSVDPLAEKYYNVSPYVYCGNNPVMYIDPDGKESMRANGGENFKRTGILIMAGGALMVAAGTAYSIVTSGGGTVAGGGQLISAGVATFKAGFVTYGAGVALDVHESIKKTDSIKPSDVSQKAHTPKKQSTGSKKKTEGRHMHGQTHGGGPKPNFKSQNNKRKKVDEHRNKGKVIN